MNSNYTAKFRELVHYATLAPSSHNTQCWKFQLEDRAISILPDLSRRCPVVDPDDHHLYVSLGCAAENLIEAAKAQGLSGQVTFDDSGDGLSGRTTGNPSIPRWLENLLFKLLIRVQPENDKNNRYIRSSAGIAVFVSDVNNKAHWVEVGRCYERFALQATALGIRNAFVNQPVEEASLRPAFARALGLKSGRPDLVVRFGRGVEMPSSLRRPVEAVIL